MAAMLFGTRPRWGWILPVTIALSLACGSEQPDRDRPLVVVSVLPQAFFVERIGADLVEIAVMIPPGASPAAHEPNLGQLEALSRASLYVKVGHPHFPFEAAWLEQLLAERRDLPVVDASAGLERTEDDPHIWVSPRHARAMARNIGTALAALLPAQAATLESRLERLLAEIDATDTEVREILRDSRGRAFFVFHPAWGYFAEEYGLRQVAIQESGKEPDPRALAEFIEEAKEAQVKVVFAQPHFDAASARVIAEELGGRVESLDPLAYDWPRNLRDAARAIAAGAGR
jgi:zinc transport system substrate-binding protein